MSNIEDAIAQSQRELIAIRAYHQDYLDRRARRGVLTSTDILMRQHQQQLSRALDLLEALKAMQSDPVRE
jgi:hypothetical protein